MLFEYINGNQAFITFVVSVSSQVCLCLEKLVNNFMYSKVRHKLSYSQHGFMKRRITFTQLSNYIDKLFSCNEDNEDFCCLFGYAKSV